VGIGLPQIGEVATAPFVTRVAREAEQLGYDSLWMFERLLRPVNPRTPYPPSPDGQLPPHMSRILEPLTTLAYIAAATSTINLGTSVLVAPLHNPVVLGKQLGTLAVLSGGRLRVGLGTGWSADEYEAAGANPRGLGAQFEEFLQVLRQIWTAEEAEFNGTHYRLPRSTMGPRPATCPKLYIGAHSDAMMRRVGRLADGWNPAFMPLELLDQKMTIARAAAKDAGRSPDELELVVRANLVVTDRPLPQPRRPFIGSWEQIAEDIQAVRVTGADELFFDCSVASVDDEQTFCAKMTRLYALATGR